MSKYKERELKISPTRLVKYQKKGFKNIVSSSVIPTSVYKAKRYTRAGCAYRGGQKLYGVPVQRTKPVNFYTREDPPSHCRSLKSPVNQKDDDTTTPFEDSSTSERVEP